MALGAVPATAERPQTHHRPAQPELSWQYMHTPPPHLPLFSHLRTTLVRRAINFSEVIVRVVQAPGCKVPAVTARCSLHMMRTL